MNRNKRNTLITIASAALLLTTSGCLSSDEGSSSTSSNWEFRNQTSFTMTELNISLASDDSWGPNQLSSSVASGQSVDFDITNCDATYDYRGIFSNGGEIIGTRFIACSSDYLNTFTN